MTVTASRTDKDNGYYESCTYSYDDNGNIISITGEEDGSGSIYPCEEFAYTQIEMMIPRKLKQIGFRGIISFSAAPSGSRVNSSESH